MTPDLNEVVISKYIKKLQRRLEYAFKKVAKYSKKEAMRSKKRYDKSTNSSKLEPGDLVLIQKKVFQEKHKILDIWEKDPYKVVKQRQDGQFL